METSAKILTFVFTPNEYGRQKNCSMWYKKYPGILLVLAGFQDRIVLLYLRAGLAHHNPLSNGKKLPSGMMFYDRIQKLLVLVGALLMHSCLWKQLINKNWWSLICICFKMLSFSKKKNISCCKCFIKYRALFWLQSISQTCRTGCTSGRKIYALHKLHTWHFKDVIKATMWIKHL